MTSTRTGAAGPLVKTLFTVAIISAVAAGAGFALERQDVSRARDEASANAVGAVTHVLGAGLHRGAIGPVQARTLTAALKDDVVGRAGIARVRLFGDAGAFLASTDPGDPVADTKTPVTRVLGVAASGRRAVAVADGGDPSAVDGKSTLATFERIRQGRGGLVVVEIDQQLAPIDATGARRWHNPTRESETATAVFLILGLVGLLARRARDAVLRRARRTRKLAPVASLSPVPHTSELANIETNTGSAAAAPDGTSLGAARIRRASDGHVARLQTELKARDDEIRRLSHEMASLARDAQARIAELEDQVSRAGERVPAPVTPLIRHDPAEAERARADAEQRAAEAESRAAAAEATAARTASRLREAEQAAVALRAELDTKAAESDDAGRTSPSPGPGQSLRDRLADAASADDIPDHLASG
jgi:hypothetical protein